MQGYPACSVCGERETCTINSNNVQCNITGKHWHNLQTIEDCSWFGNFGLAWDPIFFCGPRQGRRLSSSSLQYHGRQRGWRTWLFPVEVGVRGFCSQSICRMMTAIGTTGKVIKKLSQAAERVSSWLWLRREEKSWKHQPTHSDWSPLWAHPLWECSWIKGPKHSMTADSMLMMLVEEQTIYDCIYTHTCLLYMCVWKSHVLLGYFSFLYLNQHQQHII